MVPFTPGARPTHFYTVSSITGSVAIWNPERHVRKASHRGSTQQ